METDIYITAWHKHHHDHTGDMKFSRTTNRQTNTDIWEDTEAHRQTDRQTHTQTARQTHRHVTGKLDQRQRNTDTQQLLQLKQMNYSSCRTRSSMRENISPTVNNVRCTREDVWVNSQVHCLPLNHRTVIHRFTACHSILEQLTEASHRRSQPIDNNTLQQKLIWWNCCMKDRWKW